MTKFQEFARANHQPGKPIDEMWHPEVQIECSIMDSEAITKAQKDRERIREVVVSVEDAQKEFEGTIILHVSFKGSLPKKKALTRTEQELIGQNPSGVDRKKITGAKTLFESKEYDAIEAFKAERHREFANLGIPFPLGKAMHLIRIVNIPKAEELAAKTDRELQVLVEELVRAYPNQITREAVGLGSLYNATDYKPVETLERLFKFGSKWMHFGVPDVLKEIDQALWEKALWEKERQRTAAVWQEAKENGVALLREELASIAARLVESMEPDEKGEKKKFYATSVTNLTDFFAVFEDRNLAGDKDLAAEVEKLKALVSNKKVEAFKTDEALRSQIKKSGGEISRKLNSMLVDASARRIVLED